MGSIVERGTIRVVGDEALKYVGAIEGLIYDPQPLSSAGRTSKARVLTEIRFPLIRSEPILDDPSITDELKVRWRDDVSRAFQELAEYNRQRKPNDDERDYMPGSLRLYVVNRNPVVELDAGPRRHFTVDLQMVIDADTRLGYVFLGLQHSKDRQRPEANLFLNAQGVTRTREDYHLGAYYIPAFAEQQRLLDINTLMRKHMEPVLQSSSDRDYL